QGLELQVVAMDVLWHSEENDAQSVAEQSVRCSKPADGLLGRFAKGAHAAAALGLNGKAEVQGRVLQPACDCLGSWLAVEGVVQLDRRKPGGVRAQQVSRASARLVEARRPGRVGKAARSDVEPPCQLVTACSLPAEEARRDQERNDQPAGEDERVNGKRRISDAADHRLAQ